MMKFLRHSALVLALALSACASLDDREGPIPDWVDGARWDIDAVANLPLNDDPFLAALQEGYLRLARDELDEFDWPNGAKMIQRARLAAQGRPTRPIDVREISFGGETGDGLEKAYAQITAYLASEGAMLRAGRQIGEAQVHFDCWASEAREGHQFDDIATCREQFELMIQLIKDLADLPKNLAVVLPEDGETGGIELQSGGQTVTLDQAFAAAGTGKKFGDLPVVESEIREAFADALGAQPPPPVEFLLTFDFNSAEINDQAFEQILAAANEARGRAAAEIIVTGHADRPGDASGNLAISRRRALAVQKAIFFELRDKDDVTIETAAKGARELVVDTNQPAEENRRTVILVR